MKILAITAFAAMYVLMTLFSKKRVWFVLATAVLFLVAGIIPLKSIPSTVNWNVLMMMTGTMVLVYYFIESKMPNLIADTLLDLSPNVMWVTIFMSLFSGLISAFIDNVATVLMVAPVGLAICKKLKISPVPMVLAIAVSSNLQGAATLVGDTTSIMLGAYAKMDFTDFFWMNGRPGIFFSVEIGALMTVPVMMFLFRKDKQKVQAEQKTKVTDFMPTILLILMVAALIIASFNKDKPEITNGLICCIAASIALVLGLRKPSGTKHALGALKSIDLETLLLLTGLFVVIEGITAVGLIDDIAAALGSVGGNNLFLLYTIIVWGSVLASAFIDNIPYVATMLPVIRGICSANSLPPMLLFFGLLIGATLGGNLTPIGASANITAAGLLKKNGYPSSFKDFAKIGIPFTLIAVISGYLFTWFVWS